MRNERKGIAMSREKSYCIIKKDGYAYFPIKAKSGPYRDKADQLIIGYLAGMPNFFGGTVESDKGKDKYDTLVDEVSQESQENITINFSDTDSKDEKRKKIENACVLLNSFTFEGRNPTTYYFYCLNADADANADADQPSVTIKGFENSNVLELSTDARLKEEYREMSCILKIPVDQLCKNFVNFLDKCIETGSEYLWDKRTITEHQDWKDEGTQNAFRAFCMNYGGKDAIH